MSPEALSGALAVILVDTTPDTDTDGDFVRVTAAVTDTSTCAVFSETLADEAAENVIVVEEPSDVGLSVLDW